MKRRNVILIGLILMLSISLATGCWDRPFYDTDSEGNKLSKELLGYLENDDADGLKSMLCDITRDSPTIDDEILAAFDFFEGKITTYDKMTISTSAEESVRDGQIVFYFIGPYVKNIETDAGKIYTMKICMFLVHATDESRVGISEILIADEDGEECVIGEFLDV